MKHTSDDILHKATFREKIKEFEHFQENDKRQTKTNLDRRKEKGK